MGVLDLDPAQWVAPHLGCFHDPKPSQMWGDCMGMGDLDPLPNGLSQIWGVSMIQNRPKCGVVRWGCEIWTPLNGSSQIWGVSMTQNRPNVGRLYGDGLSGPPSQWVDPNLGRFHDPKQSQMWGGCMGM